MPPKSSTAKPVKRTTASPEGESAGAAADKSKKPAAKQKTTSLIDAEPKPKRSGALKSGSAFAPLGSKTAKGMAAKAAESAEPAKPAEPPKKSLDQEKAEALNLFGEQEKKEQAKKDRRADPDSVTAAPQGTFLPPISLLREPEAPAPLPPPKEVFSRPFHC